MIQLFDKDTGKLLGTISEAQLQFLEDQLVEETGVDQDYYINADTLDYLEDERIDPELLRLLRTALGDREDMEVEWRRE